MSSAEAEYMSLSACCAQVLWMRTQLTDYGFHFDKIPMYCDSKTAIAISCNPVQHSRTKHIDVRSLYPTTNYSHDVDEVIRWLSEDRNPARASVKQALGSGCGVGTKVVAARGVVDRVDRVKGSIFRVRRKSLPEKFSGGDGGRRNKARLVAQGYTKEEGIDYDEVFALVVRIEAIRLFLAYASFKDFIVYQMDVKSVFLYEKNEEEVCVCQPPGFEDPNFPDRVYKVEKALYGLHQAPRAWYETLSTYLLENGFQRGKFDKTLFIIRHKGDILLVQVYKKDEIFVSQDKYVAEILNKFGFTEVKTASTSMETQKLLLKDEDSKEVDVHMYRSMIGSLMYLTSSRPDIMFAVCACARYQVNPKVSHLHAVKRIF
nr:hypothetical protein [Tanacetum cinerariifolium]